MNVDISGRNWKVLRYRVIAPYTKIPIFWVTKSRPGHVVSWLKIGGPSSKAKYYLLTDSEPVP